MVDVYRGNGLASEVLLAQYNVGLAIAAVGIACAYACSPDSGDGDVNGAGTGTGTGARGGNAANGGQSGDGGPGAGNGPGNTGGQSGFGGGFMGMGGSPNGGAGGSLNADAACESTVLQPEAVEEEVTTEINCVAETPEPLSLYIMLDNSLSMDDDNKWEDAVTAITQFVQTEPTPPGEWNCTDQDGNPVESPEDLEPPQPAAISVAIQYFHPEGAGNNPNECDGSGHEAPHVPLGPLPENATAIINSLGSTGPEGYTPTVGALTGGTRYCAAQQSANPDEKCVVVLVTDGAPFDCGLSAECQNNNSNNCVDPRAEEVLTPIARSAYEDNKVISFTIGMDGVTPEGFGLLNAVAIAGGSDCTPDAPGAEACNVSGSTASGFLDALNTIRESVQFTESSSETVTHTVTTTLPCEWDIPDAPDGEELDPNLVNVIFTSGDSTQELGNVASESDCASVGGGWHYDDLDPPERILACPQTCSVLERLTQAKVEVLFGCATKPADVPH